MALEAPFADFHALAKCSRGSAVAKLSRDSALPPVVKHPSDCQQLNCRGRRQLKLPKILLLCCSHGHGNLSLTSVKYAVVFNIEKCYIRIHWLNSGKNEL